MTNEEVNQYFESIGGLENGWFADREPIMKRNFECDSGWNKLICDLIQNLIDLGWDKRVTQIKEKFGTLRFYTNSLSDDMWELVGKAEEESGRTCEVCGGKDNVSLRGDHWLQTLCDKHYTPKITLDDEEGNTFP